MGNLILAMFENTNHSNVQPPERRGFVENFGREWLPVLQRAPITVGLSTQRTDLNLFGVTQDEVAQGSVELMSSTHAHALLPLLTDHDSLTDHAMWQIDHGVHGTNIRFFSEFALPIDPRLIEGGDHYYALALPSPHTNGYSECISGDVIPSSIRNLEALRYHGKTVVPMNGTQDLLNKFFFPWQCFPDNQERLDAMLGEIQRLAEDGEDKTYVFFVDLEAPMVGSWHGLEIWQRFFEAIEANGLTNAFTSFEQAAPTWRQRAVSRQNLGLPPSWVVARNLSKWTSHIHQLRTIRRIERSLISRPASTDADHVWVSLFTVSDLLSAYERKYYMHDRAINLKADRGMITVGFDQTIIDIAITALATWESGARSPVPALRKLMRRLPPDSRWFVERVITHVLEPYGF